MPPTTDILNSKKPGLGSWTSFEDGLAEYKENELRKEWWYYVSKDNPYTTRNERRQNKKLGIFIQPFRHVKPGVAAVELPIEPEPVVGAVVEPESVVEPGVEPEPVFESVVEPVECEPVVEPDVKNFEPEPVIESTDHQSVVEPAESETVIEPAGPKPAESETDFEPNPVEAVAEVESESIVEPEAEVEPYKITEVKSEATFVETSECVLETFVAEVDIKAEHGVELELKTEAAIESEAGVEPDNVTELEDRPESVNLAEVKTVAFECEAVEPNAQLDVDVAAVTVENEPNIVSISDIAEAEETVEISPEVMITAPTEQISDCFDKETELIIDQLDTDGMKNTVTDVASVIVLDGDSKNVSEAEPVIDVQFGNESAANELTVEEFLDAEEAFAKAALETPSNVNLTNSEILQVAESELVAEAPLTEVAPVAVEPKPGNLSSESDFKDDEPVKEEGLIQNMCAKTQLPSSFYDDMKTH